MYDWNPESYARNSAGQEQWARELIAKLRLKGDERLLDIGCGDGKVTSELAAGLTGGSVLGIDSSARMVAYARRVFAARPNLSFLCVDVREMVFEGEFDVVFSNATLHWVPNHLIVLERVRRALRPSGRLLFQMGGMGNAAEMTAAVRKVMRKDPWHPFFQDFPHPYTHYSEEEYRGLLDAAGLVALRVEVIPKVMRHKGREGLAGWLDTVWHPYTQRVPGPMRERFIEEIVSAYEMEHGPDEEGFFAVAMVRLEVEAVGKP